MLLSNFSLHDRHSLEKVLHVVLKPRVVEKIIEISCLLGNSSSNIRNAMPTDAMLRAKHPWRGSHSSSGRILTARVQRSQGDCIRDSVLIRHRLHLWLWLGKFCLRHELRSVHVATDIEVGDCIWAAKVYSS